MADPRTSLDRVIESIKPGTGVAYDGTPTERLADRPLTGAVSTHDGECDLCGRPADHGPICSACFDEVWTFDTAAEAEEHARLMALTLRQECIRCGDRIEDARFALGATECEDCKRPQTTAA